MSQYVRRLHCKYIYIYIAVIFFNISWPLSAKQLWTWEGWIFVFLFRFERKYLSDIFRKSLSTDSMKLSEYSPVAHFFQFVLVLEKWQRLESPWCLLKLSNYKHGTLVTLETSFFRRYFCAGPLFPTFLSPEIFVPQKVAAKYVGLLCCSWKTSNPCRTDWKAMLALPQPDSSAESSNKVGN